MPFFREKYLPFTCGYSYDVEIPVNTCSHENTETRDAAAASCTKDGYTGDIWCTDCEQKILTGEGIPAKGHHGGMATCTQKAECELCHERYGSVDPDNHQETTVKFKKAATCTVDGYTGDIYCKECGELLEEGKVIESKGHIWNSSYSIDKKATCSEEGSKSIHCSVCDAIRENSITIVNSSEHNFSDWETIKEATSSSLGLKERICKNCGLSEKKEIAKLNPVLSTPPVSTVIPVEISPSNPVAFASVDKQITTAKGDADQKGSVFNLLQAKGVAKSKTTVKVSWRKVNGATSYIIYGNKCGAGNQFKKIATSTGTSYTQKKLKKGTYYKYLIVAVNGEKAISTSKTIHVATKGGKVGNSKSVTTKVKNKVSLKKGKSFKLGAKSVVQGKKLKVKKHRAIAYESSNKKIATVSGKGVIKAVGKGTCYIYAYAQNGVCKKIKVTVK